MPKYTLEIAEEIYDNADFYSGGIILEEDEDHQIILDGPFIRIAELGIDIYPGLYSNYDEEEKEYLPDFTIYLFMDEGSFDVVYDEGYTSLFAAVHNFMRRQGNENSVNLLKCEVLGLELA